MKTMDENALEFFFANLDEETMDRLIELYENQDMEGLDVYLDTLQLDVPKEELMSSLAMLTEMKEIM